MVYRFVSAGLAVLLSVAALTSIGAQDDVAAKDDAAAPAEKAIRPFAEVSAEWDSTDKSISELEDKYRTASAAEKVELVKQYDDLIKKSLALLPELRSAALAAYEAAPNADEKVTTTLVGLLANDVRSDRYSNALKLGNLLLKHKC